jgi:hypothetical protein
MDAKTRTLSGQKQCEMQSACIRKGPKRDAVVESHVSKARNVGHLAETAAASTIHSVNNNPNTFFISILSPSEVEQPEDQTLFASLCTAR